MKREFSKSCNRKLLRGDLRMETNRRTGILNMHSKVGLQVQGQQQCKGLLLARVSTGAVAIFDDLYFTS